jgi:hypothetical protein
MPAQNQLPDGWSPLPPGWSAAPSGGPGGSGASAPPDDRNAVQKFVDNLSTVTPEQRAGHSTPVNMAQDFGAHLIGSLAAPIVHPLDTLTGFGRLLAQASTPEGQVEAARDMVEPAVQDFTQNGASVAIPHILGDAAAAYLGGEAGGAAGGGILRGISRAADKVAPTLAESALNMRGPDRAYGAQPGRAILDDTSGFTPKKIVETGRDTMNDLQAEQGHLLANYGNAGARVDLFPARKILSDFSDRAVQENHPGTIKDIRKLSDQLQTRYDAEPPTLRSFSSEIKEEFPNLTPDEVDAEARERMGDHAASRIIPPQVSPLDAGALNRGISNAITSWNPATATDTMNAAGKMAHHSLGESIAAVVPEIAPLNERMQSLHPVLQRGTAADLNAGPTQRMIGRLRAHTGALTAGVAGVATGHPLLGLAGLGAIEGLASPEPWIAAARGLNAIGRTAGSAARSPFLVPTIAAADAATPRKIRSTPFDQ